jgi:hypothetical protein
MTVADVLDRGQLEQPGYLTHEPDPSDQRSKHIRGTPRGHAAVKAIREIVQGVETEWEQQPGPRKFTQLRDLLAQLYAITAAPDTARNTRSSHQRAVGLTAPFGHFGSRRGLCAPAGVVLGRPLPLDASSSHGEVVTSPH